MRSDLRALGIPVPLQLLEPEAWDSSGDEAPPRGEGRGADRRRQALPRHHGSRVTIRTWRCTSSTCSAWSWPSRSSCFTCGRPRPRTAQWREEQWDPARLPPWASEDALVDRDALLAPRRTDPPPSRHQRDEPRRVPGLAPLDSRRNQPGVLDDHAGGASRARQQAHRGQPQRRHQGEQTGPREHPPQRRSDHLDGQRGGDDQGDDGETWATVVSKRRPKPAAKPAARDRAPETRRSDDDHLDSDVQPPPSAPAPQDLPPPRVFAAPCLPRTVLAQQVQAAASKLDELRAKGARADKLQRTELFAQKLKSDLRAAGGPTPKALSLQLKAEDERIEREEKQLQKAEAQQAEKFEEAREAQLAAEQLGQRIQRIKERLQTHRRRRAHLAREKMAETSHEADTDTVDALRTAAAALSDGGPSCAQAFATVQRALERFLPAQVQFDLTSCDSESGDAGGARDDDPRDGADSDTDQTFFADDAQMDCDDGDDRGHERVQEEQLAEATLVLQDLVSQRHQAVLVARAREAKGKRALDDDCDKPQGAQSDVEMVEQLTEAQAEQFFAARIERQSALVHQLRSAIVFDATPPLARGHCSDSPPRAARGRSPTRARSPPPVPSPPNARTGRFARTSAEIFQGWQSQEERQLADSQQNGHRAEPHPGQRPRRTAAEMFRGWQSDEDRACQAAMAEQESLQRTQEREIAEAEGKAALVLEAKMLIEEGRRCTDHHAALDESLPPTYGPTGQALQAQQLAPRDVAQPTPRPSSPKRAVAAAAVTSGPTCRTRWCDGEGSPRRERSARRAAT